MALQGEAASLVVAREQRCGGIRVEAATAAAATVARLNSLERNENASVRCAVQAGPCAVVMVLA